MAQVERLWVGDGSQPGPISGKEALSLGHPSGRNRRVHYRHVSRETYRRVAETRVPGSNSVFVEMSSQPLNMQ